MYLVSNNDLLCIWQSQLSQEIAMKLWNFSPLIHRKESICFAIGMLDHLMSSKDNI